MVVAVADVPVHDHPLVEFGEDGIDPMFAGYDHWLARDDACTENGLGIDERRRKIALADILGEGVCNITMDGLFERPRGRIHHDRSPPCS